MLNRSIHRVVLHRPVQSLPYRSLPSQSLRRSYAKDRGSKSATPRNGNGFVKGDSKQFPGEAGSETSRQGQTRSESVSEQQDELRSKAKSDENTVPLSDGGGPGKRRNPKVGKDIEPEVSELQDEFGTSSKSRQNTAPQNSSATDPASTQDPTTSKPLPDLTKGIPSTLDAEMAEKSSSEAADPGSLNLTEDPRAGGRGGKDGGDLPKSAYVSSTERRRNRIANFMYAYFLFFATTGTIYLGRNWESEEEEKKHPQAPSGWGFSLFYNRLRARLGEQLDYYNEPAFPKLLPDMDPAFERPFTLVLSLEDLLVHSEWSREHGWRMAKRPGVDYFIRYLQQYYELVIFTSSPSFTAEPVIRKLDPYRFVLWPLFREATRYKNGEYIKDLSYLNRDLSKVVLIDTDSSHAKLQPENSIILPKWKGDPQDKDLVSYIPFLEYVATMGLTDTRAVLKSFDGKHIPTEYASREQKMREKFHEELENQQGSRPRRIGKTFFNSLFGSRPSTGIDAFDQTPAEAMEQGKMLQDHFRERAQKNYELLEKEIRENGEKWLKEMAAEDEKMREEQMKGMKSSLTGFFGTAGLPQPASGEKK